MNIFVLDNSPSIAARMYCDKHVPKMVVEMYQMLGSALRRHGAGDDMMPLTKAGTPLKESHKNHPCTRWVGDSKSNYAWAWLHAMELCSEYTLRYGKVHFCQDGINKMGYLLDIIPTGGPTPYAQAMPDEYKSDDAITAYRDYYWCEKRRFAKWNKGRDAPDWWKEAEVEECAAQWA